MLLNFEVENFRSIKDPLKISMVAGREKLHSDSFFPVKGFRGRVLPILSIYGGNASGKSNIVDAFSLSKRLIFDNSKIGESLPFHPFKLDPETREKATKFVYTLLLSSGIYTYSVEYNQKEILRESLSQLRPNLTGQKKVKILFERLSNEVSFDGLGSAQKARNVLEVLVSTLRSNLTFLYLLKQFSDGKDQETAWWCTLVNEIYEWFSSSLEIADHFYLPDVEDEKSYEVFSKILSLFDTGIEKLGQVKIDTNDRLYAELKPYMDLMKKYGSENHHLVRSDKVPIAIKFLDGEPQAYKTATTHLDSNKEPVNFELQEESVGTTKLIHLISLFLKAFASSRSATLVFDELDNSLHPLVVEKIINDFLKISKHYPIQLIFTTHAIQLLSTNVFRRDEIFLVSKNKLGETTGYTLSNSNVNLKKLSSLRYDTDLKKEYMEGNLGGIADLSPTNFLELFVDENKEK